MKNLIVEDDARLAGVLRRGLAESGHVVDVEHDGPGGEAAAAGGAYDAVLLDVMLPGKDGIAVARSLRGAGVSTPILMLTAPETAFLEFLMRNAGRLITCDRALRRRYAALSRSHAAADSGSTPDGRGTRRLGHRSR